MEQITLTYIPKPFTPHVGRITRQLDHVPGRTINQYLAGMAGGDVVITLDDFTLCAVRNGIQVDSLADVPDPGDVITLYFVPAGPAIGPLMIGGYGLYAGWSYATIAFMMFITFTLGKIASATGNKPRYDTPKPSQFDDATYGWEPGANPTIEGTSISVLYGRRLITPPVISKHIDMTDFGDQVLRRLFALCEGGSGSGDAIALVDWDIDANYKALYINGQHYTSFNLNRADQSTVDQCTYGEASNSGTGINPNYAFDDLAYTWATGSIDGSYSIIYDFGSSFRIIVQKYTILSDIGTIYGLWYTCPTAWTFDGSQDGITWVTLDTQSGQSPTNRTEYSGFTNNTLYRYYRIHPTAFYLSGEMRDPHVLFYEIEMFGPTDTELSSPIQIEFKPGSVDQVAPTAFPETFSVREPGFQISTDYAAYSTTPGGSVTIVAFGLVFPRGLYSMDYSGAIGDETVVIAAQYRIAGGSWVDFSGSPFTIVANQTSVFRFYRQVDGLTAGEYEVQIKFNTAPATGGLHSNECRWEYLHEGIADDFTYPFTSLLSVSALASEQLNGSTPRITALVERPNVLVWENSAWVAKSATNPAWICYDILVNTRYGGAVTPDRILLSEFASWAAYCDNQRAKSAWTGSTAYAIGATVRPVAGGNGYYYEATAKLGSGTSGSTEPTWPTIPGETVIDNTGANQITWACRLNHIAEDLYFDTGISHQEALDIAGLLGRGSVVQRGTMWGCIYDAPAVPVQMFTVGNIVAGTFREQFLAFADRSNAIEFNYFDRERDYSRQVIESRSHDWDDETTVPNNAQETLYGCTWREQAEAFGAWRMACNRYLGRVVTFEADIDAVACQGGDLIMVPAKIIGGRIVSATSGSVTLDRSFTLLPGTTYYVSVRHQNDTIETMEIAAVGSPTTTATLTLKSGTSWVLIPVLYAVYAMGTSADVTKSYRVTRITRSGDQRRKITALEYREEIYL